MILRLLTKPSVPNFTASAILVACLVLFGSEANALALGRVNVLSAIGEPLRAEIDIPDINPDEVSSLRTVVGSSESFRRAGLEFNTLASGVQVSLQRRADGQSFLRLTGDRVVNEPYLDLVIEANWAAGRLVRDYTLLFDPPNTRQTAPVNATPAATPPASVLVPAAATAAAVTTGLTSTVTAVVRPVNGVRPTLVPRQTPVQPPQKSTPVREGQQVTVHPGDTASKIAASVKPPTISLDQMLVALLRTNPEAFSGNVNRLKAGAVLNVPSAEQAGALPAAEASQLLVAQSRDFNEFRRKLAGGVQTAQVDAPRRSSGGKIQTQLEDKRPSSASPDKLSLLKGEVRGKNSQEKLAQDMQAREAAKRLEELNKNISDLKQLAPAVAAASGAAMPGTGPNPTAPVSASNVTAGITSSLKAADPPAPAASTKLPPAAPEVPTSAASVPAASAPGAAAPVMVPSASVPASLAAQAPASATAPMAPPAVATDTDANLLSELLENPMVPAAAGGLIALLVGLGIYRVRQRKKANQVDSSFMESRLQPDSFFGASGGQKIDTGESAEPGSSLMYSPSQLDAGADVDPVAEADVYLAYGRDLQAEEILKEALRSNPSRAAIHFKLLQIYAKRRDVKGYAVTAANAYKLSSGSGSDWAHACAVGRELDPTNPLYQGEGTASFAELPTLQAEPVASPGLNLTATDFTSAAVAPAGAVASGDLDLDLDFSAGEPTASFTTLFTSPLAAAGEAEPATALRMDTQPSQSPSPLPDLEIELADPEPPAMTRVDAIALPSLDFDTPLPHTATEGAHAALPFDANARDKLTAPAPAPLQADPAHNGDMLEFDLNSLSLDLGDAASSAAPKEAVDDGLGGEDPLVTKLALAEEFQAIGDDDGARTLAQEVADAATGNLKTKAQRFLAELG